MNLMVLFLLVASSSSCLFGCIGLDCARQSTNFERNECSVSKLTFCIFIEDHKIHLDIKNSSDELYRLDLASSFLYIKSFEWQTPLTDTHADRPTSQYIPIPPGKVNVILYPKNLIAETDEEWHDVKFERWPCRKQGTPYMGREIGGRDLECELSLHLSFLNSGKDTMDCTLSATLLAKSPKERIERYQ
jgi:hypothetical protein